MVRSTDFNRFQDKLRKGNVQLYYLGWNADYPDPKFLLPPRRQREQGRQGRRNASTTRTPNSTLFRADERTWTTPRGAALIHRMTRILQHDAPGFRAAPQATPSAMPGSRTAKPNDVGNNILKYQRIDTAERQRLRRRWNRPVVWPLGWVCPLAATLVPAWSVTGGGRGGRGQGFRRVRPRWKPVSAGGGSIPCWRLLPISGGPSPFARPARPGARFSRLTAELLALPEAEAEHLASDGRRPWHGFAAIFRRLPAGRTGGYPRRRPPPQPLRAATGPGRFPAASAARSRPSPAPPRPAAGRPRLVRRQGPPGTPAGPRMAGPATSLEIDPLLCADGLQTRRAGPGRPEIRRCDALAAGGCPGPGSIWSPCTPAAISIAGPCGMARSAGWRRSTSPLLLLPRRGGGLRPWPAERPSGWRGTTCAWPSPRPSPLRPAWPASGIGRWPGSWGSTPCAGRSRERYRPSLPPAGPAAADFAGFAGP